MSLICDRLRLFALFGALALAGLCAGCVEQMPEVKAAAATEHPRLVARPGVSLADASVAFASLDGLPGVYAARFNAALADQAKARDIAVADADHAAYLIRGYIDISGNAAATTISYVWDIFDRDHRRAERLQDEIAIGGPTADPWSLVDDKVLQTIASRSADDLAAFLSNTPQAIPVAQAPVAPAASNPVAALAPKAPLPSSVLAFSGG